MPWWTVLMAVWLVPTSEADVTYYLTGQLHPLLEVSVELNGEEVDTYRSKSGKPKIFLKQLDPSLLRPGRNEMVIHWEVLEGDPPATSPTKTGYRITLKHQKDPRDRKTAVDLVRVGGVEVPLPAAGTSGSDRLEFQTLVN